MGRKNSAKGDYLAGIREDIQEKVQACIQCGTCTGSCSSAFAMDLTPRYMWRLVQLGQFDEVLNSKTFFLCSACYYCTLRCPRGLPLTETIGALKRLAGASGIKRYKESTNFYRAFMETVKRYGRVREMEFMNRYFLSMKNPLFPLRFASMGLKLIGKRKVPLQAPMLIGKGKFDRLFSKVEKLEKRA
ncbi:MAG: 4Fe-4S dicluster domain-containing protein [Deltaproteobacteria bacterium]|nr:4Fe-4S dicluster domain-containing protein [Deltaproteobacteria bacterium]